MVRSVLFAAVFSLAATAALAAPATPAAPAQPRPTSLVDYDGFAHLTGEVAAYRRERLVNLETFKAMAGEGDTLVLDARSPEAFARGHIAGAVNLTFTDFTAGALARVIGDPNRRVLIYCNNNFLNDIEPVRTKSVRLALNIQTFINLYGYGYRNVYELRDAVDLNDPTVGWEATTANPTIPMAFVQQP